MDLFRQQRNRTVTIACNEVLSRRDVICALVEVFGSDKSKILSVGELHPRRWEVVLADDATVSSMISKSRVTCRGKTVTFEALRRQPRRLRVKRVPACIPNDYIGDLLCRRGLKVVNIVFERDPVDGLGTNTRLVLVDADDWELVPDVLPWVFDGMRGSALLFLAGRPPRCHRCHDRGHQVKDCPVQYCRVCRRTGHETSEECRNRRTTYADRVAASAVTNVDDDDAVHDGDEVQGAGGGELVPAGQRWSEIIEVEQQSSEVAPADADAENVPADDSSDEHGDVETTDMQVDADADGFRRPTDHIRRQQRAKKRLAKKSPTESVPRKMSVTATEESDVPATTESFGAAAATSSASAAALADDDNDPTVRRYSRTRVPTSRRRTSEERRTSV